MTFDELEMHLKLLGLRPFGNGKSEYLFQTRGLRMNLKTRKVKNVAHQELTDYRAVYDRVVEEIDYYREQNKLSVELAEAFERMNRKNKRSKTGNDKFAQLKDKLTHNK